MARDFTALPTLDFAFLKPQRISADVKGSSIEGGRNLAGETISMEMSGGGILTASFENCWIQAAEEHEYINLLGARLNGSYRMINVPIKTDWWGPFPVIDGLRRPFVVDIPHSDGSMFSDGAGYSQATAWGEVAEDASVGAGLLRINATGLGRPLRYSDWFSILHPVKGWRAYRYWDVLDAPSGNDGAYLLAIVPPLREAVATSTRVEFAMPRFAAILASGTTIPWEAESFWISRPTLQFVEAF